MVELKIYLSEKLNEQFRRMAMNVYGYGRGSLSKAAEEALAIWCTAHEGPGVPDGKTQRREDGRSGTEAEPRVNPDERERTTIDAKNVDKQSPGESNSDQ